MILSVYSFSSSLLPSSAIQVFFRPLSYHTPQRTILPFIYSLAVSIILPFTSSFLHGHHWPSFCGHPFYSQFLFLPFGHGLFSWNRFFFCPLHRFAEDMGDIDIVQCLRRSWRPR